MVKLRKRNRLDTLTEKMDEITQLADAMIQLPVRPRIPVQKVFYQELKSAKGRLIFKNSPPSKVNNH